VLVAIALRRLPPGPVVLVMIPLSVIASPRERAARTAACSGPLAVTFASLSLVSMGGANALLQEIRRQIVVDVRGWMDNANFVDLFAISQVAPGHRTKG
jgi:chromate transporter